MESPLKFQQLNSELLHMKHTHEAYQSDLQAVKIRLVCFLGNSELSFEISVEIPFCPIFYNGS